MLLPCDVKQDWRGAIRTAGKISHGFLVPRHSGFAFEFMAFLEAKKIYIMLTFVPISTIVTTILVGLWLISLLCIQRLIVFTSSPCLFYCLAYHKNSCIYHFLISDGTKLKVKTFWWSLRTWGSYQISSKPASRSLEETANRKAEDIKFNIIILSSHVRCEMKAQSGKARQSCWQRPSIHYYRPT